MIHFFPQSVKFSYTNGIFRAIMEGRKGGEIMKTYRIYQIDAFTTERFRGNPAGVVPNADGLSDTQMQQIARELNNSETAFIHSGDGDCDVHVRFFTPTREVPICGHATVSAHYTRALELGIKEPCTVLQKTGAGILPVDILPLENGDYEIRMTQGEISVEPLECVEEWLCSALGISVDDLREDCPIAIASTGHSKVMVGIKSRELLHSLNPNQQALAELSAEIGCNGYYVFTLSPDEDILVHGRMFAPAIGIAEDPVTGNANGPLGAYLCHYGLIDTTADCADFTAMQGEAIGRAGQMKVHVELSGGKPTKVQISGRAVVAFKTEIEL